MIKPHSTPGDVSPYDFRKPSRISPERQRLLEASHEQLAQGIQGWVSGRLRAPFGVRLESTGHMGYGAFISQLPPSGAYFVYDVVGRPGMTALVSLDPSVAFVLIERLLGGGEVTEIPDRSLTPLERVVVKIVTDRMVRELSSVWKDHVRLDFEWARFESAPELIEMAGRDDDVLLVTLEVEVGALKGTLQIALPFPVMEPFFNRGPVRRAQSPTASVEERERERLSVEALVRQASTVVSARLPSVRIPLRKLHALEPGDILATGLPASTPAELHVADVPRFLAREGRLGPWVGVEIVGPWKPGRRPAASNRLTLESTNGE